MAVTRTTEMPRDLLSRPEGRLPVAALLVGPIGFGFQAINPRLVSQGLALRVGPHNNGADTFGEALRSYV